MLVIFSLSNKFFSINIWLCKTIISRILVRCLLISASIIFFSALSSAILDLIWLTNTASLFFLAAESSSFSFVRSARLLSSRSKSFSKTEVSNSLIRPLYFSSIFFLLLILFLAFSIEAERSSFSAFVFFGIAFAFLRIPSSSFIEIFVNPLSPALTISSASFNLYCHKGVLNLLISSITILEISIFSLNSFAAFNSFLPCFFLRLKMYF